LITVSTVTEPPVVVGLDLSDASVGALVWAAGEAAAHHAPLVALYVLDPRGTEAVYSQTGERTHLAPDEAVDRVKELIGKAGVGPLEHVFEIGVPGRVLVHRSRGARMLVLGQAMHHHQGAGGAYRPGPSLGAVARACVAFAECPVVVVPERLADPTAARTAAPELHEALHGGRAIYPFQGRLPVAHQ
jgi:nucleotide-binding universal stress UspA family protein